MEGGEEEGRGGGGGEEEGRGGGGEYSHVLKK